jgi:uncharacterized protein (DUF433 family)
VSTAASYPHVVIDPAGVARIDKSRYKVAHLAAEHFQHGWSAEELLRQHSELRPEQVYAALAYFYDHFDEFVAQMSESAASAESARQTHGMSRNELLKRDAAKKP